MSHVPIWAWVVGYLAGAILCGVILGVFFGEVPEQADGADGRIAAMVLWPAALALCLVGTVIIVVMGAAIGTGDLGARLRKSAVEWWNRKPDVNREGLDV